MYLSTLNSQEFSDLFKPLFKDDALMLYSINPFKCVCLEISIRNVLVILLLFFLLAIIHPQHTHYGLSLCIRYHPAYFGSWFVSTWVVV